MEISAPRQNGTLKEPLYGGSAEDMEGLSTRLTDNIDAINDAVQTLEDYEMRLGTGDDSKRLRSRMREQLAATNDLVKKTSEILRQFEGLKLKKKEEMDFRSKILKRTKDNFIKQTEKFNKVSKDIQTKEKIYQDVREIDDKRATTLSMAPTEAEHQLQIQNEELDYTETLQNERATDIQDIRRFAHEINLTAQYQARKIQENAEDIVVIHDNFQTTENFTVAGNKELEDALKNQRTLTKRNLICLFLVLAICGIIIWLVVSNTIS